MASRNKTHEITIKGIVTPVEWDEEENVTAVLLEGDNEEAYYIESNTQGDRLLEHIDAYVKLTGMVRELDGEKMVSVRTFLALEDTDDDEDSAFDESDDASDDDGWDLDDAADRREVG